MLLCVGFSFSCHQGSKVISPELAMVDSIIWDHPDSALALLEKMPKPAPSDKLNHATWCLLYTQAWDKNYKKHTSDSLINIAIEYFAPREDARRKAQVWFYKASVFKDLSKLEEATAYYVQAKDLIGSFDDPLFACLICQTLGRVYREQKLYDKAFELFRKAIHLISQVPRRNDWSYAYSELGRTFAECGELDSARYYFEQSLENGILINDLQMQSMAIGDLGVVYQEEGNYEKALEYEKEGLILNLQLEDSINLSAAKYGVATVFYQMGKLDSAEVYLKEAMNTSHIGRIRTVNLLLYFITKKQLRYEDAFRYIEQYRLYNDSINNMERTKAIAEVQVKYDNEKLENEKKTLLLEKDRLQASILWGGIIMILLISLIAFTYQRKLWLKEKKLRKYQEDVQEYVSNLHTNEEIILQKQALIQSLSRDLKDKGNLEELVSDQTEQINRLQQDTAFLKSQNQEYQCKIDTYTRSTKQHEDRVIKLEKLSNQNLSLKSREAFLIDYINKHVDLFKKLREKPRYVEWTLLFESLDILHNGFYSRLKKEFPALNEADLQICCLIKIGLTTSQIADIICISAPSITKRKYRIRERMSQTQEELQAPTMALDIFLMNY